MTKRLELSTGMMRTNARLHADQLRDYENVKAVAEAMVERDPNVLCCIKRLRYRRVWFSAERAGVDGNGAAHCAAD